MIRNKLTLGLSAFSFTAIFLGSYALPIIAYASTTPYQASYVLGHTDGGGSSDFTASDHDNGSGSVNAVGMRDPYGTALDTTHHRLYVADSSNCRVLIYNLDATNNPISHSANYVLGAPDLTTAGSCNTSQNSLNGSTAVAADSINNRLFVNNNNSVLVFDFANGITSGMDASYVLGQPDFTTTGCAPIAQNTLCNTNYDGLVYDGVHNRLFVMGDWFRIMVFNVSPSHISNGENADYVIGAPDFTTECNVVSQNCLDWTEYNGVAYDDVHDRLFVANGAASRVLVFDLSNGITNGMNASYVIGQPDFTSSSSHSPGTQNSFGDLYSGVAYNSVNQQLFVDDSASNKRMLVFDLSNGITNGMNARAVIGASDFTSVGDGSASKSTLGSTYSNSIAIDPINNQLYLPDAANNRVIIYKFAHITTPTVPNPVLGQPYSQSFALEGQQGTVTYSVSAGSLPPGLSLNTTTGLLSGTPTTAGTYTFEISTTDDNGTMGVFYADPAYTVTISNSVFGIPDTGLGGPANNSASNIVTNSIGILSSFVLGFGLQRTRRP